MRILVSLIVSKLFIDPKNVFSYFIRFKVQPLVRVLRPTYQLSQSYYVAANWKKTRDLLVEKNLKLTTSLKIAKVELRRRRTERVTVTAWSIVQRPSR